MPRFDTIDGINIECYSGDHSRPHVHAIYAEYAAKIEIKTLTVVAGSLPVKQLKRARKYVRENEADLIEYYNRLNEKIIRDDKNS